MYKTKRYFLTFLDYIDDLYHELEEHLKNGTQPELVDVQPPTLYEWRSGGIVDPDINVPDAEDTDAD